jgi:hypothetical protein
LSIKYFCPVCKNKVVIELLPDYSSSALFCTNPKCGCEISDPRNSLPKLSEETISLIEIWNQFWDNQMTNASMDTDEFRRIFENVGSHLAEEISKKYECKFVENNPNNFVYLNEG